MSVTPNDDRVKTEARHIAIYDSSSPVLNPPPPAHSNPSTVQRRSLFPSFNDDDDKRKPDVGAWNGRTERFFAGAPVDAAAGAAGATATEFLRRRHSSIAGDVDESSRLDRSSSPSAAIFGGIDAVRSLPVDAGLRSPLNQVGSVEMYSVTTQR